MKVISIWQPWASLVVHGMKFFETRSWPAPKSLIGETIGIAATKAIRPEQRDAYLDPDFQKWYSQTALPPLEELPRGYLLGTVQVHSCEQINQDLRDDITEEELAFGIYDDGRYAWRLRYPRLLEHPIPIRGVQGILDWKGDLNGTRQADADGLGAAQEMPQAQDAAHKPAMGTLIHLAQR